VNKHDKSMRGCAKLPKGAYYLPNGNFITEHRHQVGNRRITIRAVHKNPPDYEKLARVFLVLAEDMVKKERKRDL